MTAGPTHELVILLDDARHACAHLAPMVAELHGAECVLVACAPRMTHRVSKWVSHGARENWRQKWAAKQFGMIQPWLRAQGVATEGVLARGPVGELLDSLRPRRLIDARRPRLDDRAHGSTSAQRYEQARQEGGGETGRDNLSR